MRKNTLNIHNIENLRGCTDYRLGDLFFRSGITQKWYDSALIVKTSEKYKNTIGQDYLLNEKKYKDTVCLHTVLEKYKNIYNLQKRENELVLHLRVGDTIFDPWYLKQDYITKIYNKLQNNIEKITVTSVYSWADIPDKKEWKYSDNLLFQNKLCLEQVFNKLDKEFSKDYDLGTVSTQNTDYDLLYCITSKIFVEDIYKSSFNKFIRYARYYCYGYE